MHGWQTKKRQVWINLTSLIDVLFLLVIFLAVNGEFLNKQQVQITLPASSVEAQPVNDVLNILMDKNQNLWLNDQRYDWEGLSTALAKLAYDRAQTVRLEVDEAAPYGSLIRLMDSLRNNGFSQISLVTKLVE